MTENSFLKATEEWLEEVTIDGVPNIIRSRKNIPSLIFWSIMFSLCLGFSVFLVFSLIDDYNQHDVLSKDRLISYNELRFPVVTLCNENPFLSPKANEFLKVYFYEKYGVNVSSYKEILEFLGPDQLKLNMKRALYNLMSPKFSDETRKSMGYSADDTFLTISFFDYELNKTENLKWFFDPVYGNCYRINIDFMNATQEGYGLSAEIFTGLPYEQHSYLFEPLSKGIRVEIKDPDNYPYIFKSVLIQPSALTIFTLAKKTSQLLPKPFSKCDSLGLKATPFVDEMKRQGIIYDRGLCYMFALQNWTLHNHGCHNLFYPRLSFDSSSPPCLNESVFNSSEPIESDMNSCPLDCDQILYQLFYSQAPFPAENYYQKLIFENEKYFKRIFNGQVPSFNALKTSFAKLLIVYEKLAIEEVTEQPKIEFLSLISNIGGGVGLFIGLSVLTLTEIFELLFVFFGIRVSSRRRVYEINEQSKKPNVNESLNSESKSATLRRFRLFRNF